MESGRHLACLQLCPSLPTLTFITSWAAKPPIKAFMGARSPAATYDSFRMRSSSRMSCCTAGRARAFTACAKVTSSVASSWKGKQNQERTSQANCGERDRERLDGRTGELWAKNAGWLAHSSTSLWGRGARPCWAQKWCRAWKPMCSWPGREYLAKSVITKSGSASEAGKDFCGKWDISTREVKILEV